jgi:hypothetical protein
MHVHCPCEATVNTGTTGDAAIGLIKLWLKLKMARVRKTKIFWTVHNLRPHERHRPILEWLFWWAFIPNIDGVNACLNPEGTCFTNSTGVRDLTRRLSFLTGIIEVRTPIQ